MSRREFNHYPDPAVLLAECWREWSTRSFSNTQARLVDLSNRGRRGRNRTNAPSVSRALSGRFGVSWRYAARLMAAMGARVRVSVEFS